MKYVSIPKTKADELGINTFGQHCSDGIVLVNEAFVRKMQSLNGTFDERVSAIGGTIIDGSEVINFINENKLKLCLSK